VKGLAQFTRYTIVAPEKFRHNLSAIRRAHVAVSSGELEVGNHCVDMPVFADGKVLAAIEVQLKDPQSDRARVSPALALACGGLSRELSGGAKGRRPVGQPRAGRPVVQGTATGLDVIAMASI
jgi:DNA-binding IclR family transcriptional regulator